MDNNTSVAGTNSVINLTYDQVVLHANTLEQVAEDLRNVNLTLKTMLDYTLAPWQGHAKQVFIEAFTTFKPSLDQSSSVLRVLSMKLHETAKTVKHLDEGN